MQAIRLKIKQNKAHYRRPETVKNKMTYPLPPFSTIIGALHNACGYTEYHKMDISVQGKYSYMDLVYKTEYIRLDRVHYNDSRGGGRLVKLFSENVLTGKELIIAEAKKKRGSSYFQNNAIQVRDKKEYDIFVETYRKKNEDELKIIASESGVNIQDEKELALFIKNYNLEKKKLKKKYAEIVPQQTRIETLNDVELVIHIKADDEVLADIEDNIYNLTAIGRSEDFIDLIEIKRVTLTDEIDQEYQNSDYMAYIDKSLILNDEVFTIGGEKTAAAIPAYGTVYHIDKDYQITDNKRVFNRKKVCAVSNYAVDVESTSVFIDEDGFIVNFN